LQKESISPRSWLDTMDWKMPPAIVLQPDTVSANNSRQTPATLVKVVVQRINVLSVWRLFHSLKMRRSTGEAKNSVGFGGKKALLGKPAVALEIASLRSR
jgi:hypothetical protein